MAVESSQSRTKSVSQSVGFRIVQPTLSQLRYLSFHSNGEICRELQNTAFISNAESGCILSHSVVHDPDFLPRCADKVELNFDLKCVDVQNRRSVGFWLWWEEEIMEIGLFHCREGWRKQK